MKANTVILSSCRKPLSFASRVCTVALFSLLASQAQATSYDAVADFSRLTNTDTSTWSYRYQTGTVRDGIYLLLPIFTDAAGMLESHESRRLDTRRYYSRNWRESHWQ